MTMRLKLISCEVFYREISYLVSRSPNQVDVEFLPKGLHDIGAAGMRDRVKAILDQVDESLYDAILLGYGLCNNGLAGLQARSIPLVLPRAHDCITLFLGDRSRYINYFNDHPGVYFQTSGWIERGEAKSQLNGMSIQSKNYIGAGLDVLIKRYGEENGRYLFEMLGNDTEHYQQITFIEMGVEPDNQFEKEAKAQSIRKGWLFEKIQGDLKLLKNLVDGNWDCKDFLVTPPHNRIAASYDDNIVNSEQIEEVSSK